MIKNILDAAKRISNVTNRTPVMTSSTLNEELGCEVFMKCENFQRGGAFKFRGAYNAISKLSDQQKDAGIIAHSSGNHAQGVALSGKLLGIKTVIVMPENAPLVKVNATRGYGADVVFCSSTIEDRTRVCNSLIEKHGYTFIHPFDNDDIIEGAASATVELTEEVENLDILIVPIGGGGLISGSSSYAKLSGKIPIVIGVEPDGANDAYRSFETGERVLSHTPNTICDGLLTTLSDRTFSYINKYVDEIVTVNDDEILIAMKFVWERMKIIIEPSSATVLAALRKLRIKGGIEDGKRVGLIFSGGNVDINEFFDLISKKIHR